MKEISNHENLAEHFRSVMKAHSDADLIEVLKKRKRYQPEAAKQAILEAISRGIINSEQDLSSERFADDKQRFEWFPKIGNAYTRKRIKRSITRALLIVGIIPLVWGVISWGDVSLLESIIIIAYGLIWCTVTFRLMLTYDMKLAYSLLFLLIPGLFYLIRLILINPFIQAYEILFAVVLTAFVLYGVVYLKKLQD